ncbi:unnamed protein product [Heterobilharzia americana]|nr:unnamed protein product [Heterobilharzia americana]
MLQQTQVKTVIDYYHRWMKKWPNVGELALASLDDINSVWSGLGYYSRARLLHEGAKKIVNEYAGNLPQSAESLKSTLPGVGRYTAGAISSIAFNQCTPALDGNVIRVLTRLREIGSPIQLPVTMESLWNLATELVDPDQPGDFNQALMELGAVCCTPKQPSCSKCPLNEVGLCGSYQRLTAENKRLSKKVEHLPTEIEDCHLCIDHSVYLESLGVMNYPVKLSKREPRKQNTIVIVTHTSRLKNGVLEDVYLLLQRPKTGLLAGLWEFPSYTVETFDNKNVKPVKEQRQIDDVESFLPLALNRITSALKNSSSSIVSCDDFRVQSVGEVAHIFSHIHMTYVVFTLKLEEKHLSKCLDENISDIWPPDLNFGRWVNQTDLHSSAISTATKKIFAHFENYSKLSNKKAVANPHKGKRNTTKTPLLVDSKQAKLDSFFR